MPVEGHPQFPTIAPLGLSGLLVRFADSLSEPANRAAIAFRAAIAGEDWPELVETATALASVYARFDPMEFDPQAAQERLAEILDRHDWFDAALPQGRSWRIPALFEGNAAPQLEAVAEEAGLDRQGAIDQLTGDPLRVLTLGFAPGQPYLGTLPGAWDLPRQTGLTGQVPRGALAVAVRQVVMFSAPMPTGWRQVGQTPFRPFRPEAETPFPLSPGDLITFVPVDQAEFDRLANDPDGGATSEVSA